MSSTHEIARRPSRSAPGADARAAAGVAGNARARLRRPSNRFPTGSARCSRCATSPSRRPREVSQALGVASRRSACHLFRGACASCGAPLEEPHDDRAPPLRRPLIELCAASTSPRTRRAAAPARVRAATRRCDASHAAPLDDMSSDAARGRRRCRVSARAARAPAAGDPRRLQHDRTAGARDRVPRGRAPHERAVVPHPPATRWIAAAAAAGLFVGVIAGRFGHATPSAARRPGGSPPHGRQPELRATARRAAIRDGDRRSHLRR